MAVQILTYTLSHSVQFYLDFYPLEFTRLFKALHMGHFFLGANVTNSGPFDINTNALQTEKKGQPTC